MATSIHRKTHYRKKKRFQRKLRIRKNMYGTKENPRLCVFKSLKHISAQIIDDVEGTTLVSASSIGVTGAGGNCKGAEIVGEKLGKLAFSKGIQHVIFDRNGFAYHGRIMKLAEAVRKQGVKF